MALLFRKPNEAISCTAFGWGRCPGIPAPAFTEQTPSLQRLRFAGHEMGPKGRHMFLHVTVEFP